MKEKTKKKEEVSKDKVISQFLKIVNIYNKIKNKVRELSKK